MLLGDESGFHIKINLIKRGKWKSELDLFGNNVIK